MGASLSNTYFYASEVIFPIGTIVSFAKSLTGVPAITGSYWVECNGQVLNCPSSPLDGQTMPNLNGAAGGAAEVDGQKYQRFLRGAATSGGAGGNNSCQYTVGTVGGADVVAGSKSILKEPTSVGLPSYYTVVWLIRVL